MAVSGLEITCRPCWPQIPSTGIKGYVGIMDICGNETTQLSEVKHLMKQYAIGMEIIGDFDLKENQWWIEAGVKR